MSAMVRILELNLNDWLATFKQTVGRKNSHCFVPLPTDMAPREFAAMLEALLADEPAHADRQIAALDARGIRYALVRITNGTFGQMWGFMEQSRPGEPDYCGWGAALVRPGAGHHTIYQAPHPQSDRWTDNLALHAFRDDPHAAVALFAGTNRYANGRRPASADVAHTTTNVFHALTAVLANRGRSVGTPYWFVQLHGSEDRSRQPVITASHGTITSDAGDSGPLLAVQRHVQAEGYVTIGLCGIGQGKNAPGAYRLCGTRNIQGRLLESLELRHTFLHIEIAQSARTGYQQKRDPGHAGVQGLLEAVRHALSQPPTMRART